jgi:hypothetical protein
VTQQQYAALSLTPTGKDVITGFGLVLDLNYGT